MPAKTPQVKAGFDYKIMPKGIYQHKSLLEEHKQKISNALKNNIKVIEAAKKRWSNSDYRKKNFTSKGKHWKLVNKIKKKCYYCGKRFEIYPSKEKFNQGKFCSVFCRAQSPELKRQISELLKGKPSYWKGKKHSMESRVKISKAIRGKKHWNWKGGIESQYKRIRKGVDFKIWREKVFKQDNYVCWICEEKGKKLHPHHLKKFSNYPKLRFDVKNGLSLCEFCHKTYTKFGGYS